MEKPCAPSRSTASIVNVREIIGSRQAIGNSIFQPRTQSFSKTSASSILTTYKIVIIFSILYGHVFILSGFH